MKFNSILIVTYGRSGSTLLMGVLNAIPGVQLRGENMNFCFGLFEAYKSLVATKSVLAERAQDPTQPFYGADHFDENAFFSDARNLLRRQLLPEELQGSQCWGFKEIRYLQNGLRTTEGYELRPYLDFLARLLPEPAFVFLTRDHEAVAASAFWKRIEKDATIVQMEIFEREAREWSRERADSFWIDYADMVQRDATLEALFKFLGAEYDDRRIAQVMSREHSYGGKPGNLAKARRRGVHQVEVETFIPAGVAVAKLDKIPRTARTGKPFEIGGIVLLSTTNASTFRLAVEGGEGTPTVYTGLSSPRYQQQHPGNPHAELARFRIEGLKISESQPLTVFYEDVSGKRDPLFRLKLS